MATPQKITPCLWFDGQAEEAAGFYTSLFKDSRIVEVSRYGPDMPMPEGTVLTVAFELQGQRFTALNGGPQFPFTEAISLQVDCEDQAEADYFWDALTDGGEESMCGWLKDRFGVSWQIIPREFTEIMGDPDPARVQRATAAMMTMRRLDVAELRRAADGG
ncbi:VOC family protein [Thalassiella azotivora]